MGIAGNILELYGIRRFFADVDRDRDFTRDGEHIVSATLDWLLNEGFYDFFTGVSDQWQWEDSHEYRQRYLVKSIRQIGMV